MDAINFKKEMTGTLDAVIAEVTELLKAEGFGILTRIDFHTKMKEKLGKDLPATVILGACNPQMAFEAWSANPDATSLLPCNVVVRDIGGGKLSVEIAKPSTLMKLVGEKTLDAMTGQADERLQKVLERLGSDKGKRPAA